MVRRTVALSALSALAGGCFVLGFDFDVESRDNAASSGGAGASGGAAGAGGGGGSAGAPPACTQERGTPCYTGPDSTAGVGTCLPGAWVCTAGMTDTCEGEVLPAAEDCATMADDESCDSFAICTGDSLWYLRNPDGIRQSARRARADLDGNVYVVGDFTGNLSFPGATDTPTSIGGEDLWVARLTPLGAVEWVRTFGSDEQSGIEDAGDLAIDSDGGVVVVGRLAGQETAAGTLVNMDGGAALFVARLSPIGDVTWARAYPANTSVTSPRVGISPITGEIVLAGGFLGDLAFGGMTLQNTGVYEDVFVARLEAGGDFIEARKLSTAGEEYARGVAVGQDGSVAIVGHYDDAISFDAFVLPEYGVAGLNAFVALLSPTLVTIWADGFGNDQLQTATDVARGPDGTVSLTGAFAGSTDFGGAAFLDMSVTTAHACYATFTAAGRHERSHCFIVMGQASVGSAIDVDGAGNVVLSGSYSSKLDGADPTVDFGLTDAFVTKLDPTGLRVWSHYFGTVYDDVAQASSDPSGNVLLAMTAWGTLTFDGATISGNSEGDALVAKLLH